MSIIQIPISVFLLNVCVQIERSNACDHVKLPPTTIL